MCSTFLSVCLNVAACLAVLVLPYLRKVTISVKRGNQQIAFCCWSGIRALLKTGSSNTAILEGRHHLLVGQALRHEDALVISFTVKLHLCGMSEQLP
jgi:hypothetical protein